MRVIVTGGSGLIGRALVDNLAQDGREVVVLSRNPEAVKNLPNGSRLRSAVRPSMISLS